MSKRTGIQPMVRVAFGQPSVVAVSSPAEKRWGHYQFPGIARLDDGRLAVNYSVQADSAMSYGQSHPTRISSDGGKTWREAQPGELDASTAGGIIFPDGEAIKFPVQKPLDAAKLNLPKFSVALTDLWSRKSDCYRLGDLPEDLQRVRLLRRKPGETQWREEWARIAIPEMVVCVMRWEWSDIGFSDPNILTQPRICTDFFWTFTPDGGLLTFFHDVFCFNPDGSLPARCRVGVLRSDDRGRTWRLWSMLGYFPDAAAEQAATQPFLDDPNSNYNRLWGGKDAAPIPDFNVFGLNEPGAMSFGDGRMLCVMRTSSGGTHEPMFIARSTDWGKTWTSPEILTPFGVVPRMAHLDNGVIALVYGRPGVQLLFCTDGKGVTWHTPMTLLPEPGEKTRATVGRRKEITTDRQAGHDDTCGNCTVLKTGPDRFLVAYSDFRHVNAAGQTCKAIKVQEVTVTSAGAENKSMQDTF
ncbi:MAG: sialidase family protein [Kiritimatiellaeota bacterium]|nr:sialidase family protein [Kiritimatiellota bacterium]